MGDYDIYCFICGNTNISFKIKNQYIEREEDIDDKILLKKLKLFEKKTLWLNKITFLTSYDNIIHNVENTNFDYFKDNKKQMYYLQYPGQLKLLNVGYFLHTDCWNHIKNKFKINLKYSDIPFNQIQKINDKYNKIEQYYDQYFNFSQVISDNNYYVCHSPLEDKKNASRINKILSKIKIKNNLKRKSPNTSATFYNNKEIKIGNDNNFWIIRNKKWFLLENNVQEYNFTFNNNNKNLFNFLCTISKKAEHNNKPIFIKDVSNNKNKYTVFILYNQDTKYIIDKIVDYLTLSR